MTDACRMCGLEHTEPPCAYGPPKPLAGLEALFTSYGNIVWSWDPGHEAAPITEAKLRTYVERIEAGSLRFRDRPNAARFTSVDTT